MPSVYQTERPFSNLASGPKTGVHFIAMLTRQTGHFFFEPNGYDNVNKVSNEYKEAVKVGYNQTRKIVLLIIWGLAPFALYVFPLFGMFDPPVGRLDFIRQVGTVWLVIGIGGGLFRMIQLFVTRDGQTGLVWVFKVLTDPLHNVALYYKSPLALLRGELMDTSVADAGWGGDEAEKESWPRLFGQRPAGFKWIPAGLC
ncbi:hypothetical protein J4G43_015110 [Bradyrhizobium barranii subsp. barranii]|uniref:Uncharacterized protein n=1 Tax=Bradyrhizobium barranii subsp. barranii TaxID=2823807 RepID=A0A9X9Y676_9BRAD|nr:hypothetical protein [Bradyrhizobium barranii]UEM15420.1 hypothetical protein J4G43_015110 [Bradyrhizobium barranii subsp. barranii]